MSDLIRKAVELADGWRNIRGTDVHYVQSPFTGLCGLGRLSQGEKDALAAQLVRQVDALKIQLFESGGVGQALVWKSNHLIDKTEVRGPDRTLNTIKAIVESGVLE